MRAGDPRSQSVPPHPSALFGPVLHSKSFLGGLSRFGHPPTRPSQTKAREVKREERRKMEKKKKTNKNFAALKE
jgi:hypothetical protein